LRESLSIILLIFLSRGSLVKGGRPFSLAGCVRYDEIRGQFAAIALKHAKHRTVFREIRHRHVIPVRGDQSYGFAAAIVSKHHTHTSVNICAHARMFVPPAFVVKARWHDAAVIDVRDKVPSRWLQKLISDVAGVSNITAIDSEYRRRGREIVTLNLSCEYWFKIQSYYLDVLLKISCLTHTHTHTHTHVRTKLIKSKFFLSTILLFFNYL